MFAIEITEDNMQKIIDREVLSVKQYNGLKVLVNSPTTWYFITGYVTERGELHSWTFRPASYFEKRFDYNTLQIKTDWTIAVRL